MKKTYLFILSVIMCITAHAQSVKQGTHLIKGGYGFPNVIGTYLEAYKDELSYKTSNYGPIYAKYEYLVTDKVGIGINVATAHNEATYEYTDAANPGQVYRSTIKRDTYSILMRINKHFGNLDKIDPYFGGGLGYRKGGWKQTYTGPEDNNTNETPTLIPFGFEFTLGANIFFNEKIGMYAEAGFAKSPVQLGFVVKF